MHHHTINVRVDNHTATLSRPYDYDKLIPYWSHSVENYNHILRARPFYRQCKVCHQYPGKNHDTDHDYIPTWDGRIKYLKRDQLPAGLFWATYKEVDNKFKIKNRSEGVSKRKEKYWVTSEGKHIFQNECTDAIYHNARRGRGGLILNCTASGKTRISAMAASRLDCEILFVVDQLVLLRQAREDISKHLGEKVGYVGESKFHLERVTVATIQTLNIHSEDYKFLRWYRNVEIIFIDELHEQLNKSNFKVVHIARPLAVFGLTATLGLSKKTVRLKAYSLCGPVIYEYPVQRGMKEGVLSKGLAIQLKYDNSIKNLNLLTQQKAYRRRIVRNGERNYLITRLAKYAIKEGKYVIIVVDRLKHLIEISERLDNLHITHKVVAGSYKGKSINVKERFKSKDKFEIGKIKCLVVNRVFKKGIDIKRLDLIINGAGKPSTNDSIQIFGRGVRTHKDKTGLIHFDINDYDRYDVERRHWNKENPKDKQKLNWLARAAKRRIKALKQAGITIKTLEWNDKVSFKSIIKQAEHWLKKEIYGKV